uniref:Repressor protein CI n=1 Tax=Dulem virus 39 TaxID=3145757 RepID=A0AAU8B5I9_9CAUD
MYKIFEELCTSRNVTPYRVGKETGIATSTFSDWKNGKSTPKTDKLQKIADYFDVTVDYLTKGEEPRLLGFPEQAELLVKIRNDKRLFNAIEKYYTFNDKQKEHVLDLIDLLGEV